MAADGFARGALQLLITLTAIMIVPLIASITHQAQLLNVQRARLTASLAGSALSHDVCHA